MVCPWAMKTLLTDSVTAEVSLLESATVTPPVPAGDPSVTWNGDCCPGANATLAGRVITPETDTVAVVSGILGILLAWMVAEPGARAVTGTCTVGEFPANVTVEGTDATVGSVEIRLIITPPAGAGNDRVRVRFCVPRPENESDGGANTAFAITCTVELAGAYPVAVAVILTVPKLTPDTVGWTAGTVCPAGMVTDAAESATFVGSPLASRIVTGEEGAEVRLTLNGTV